MASEEKKKTEEENEYKPSVKNLTFLEIIIKNGGILPGGKEMLKEKQDHIDELRIIRVQELILYDLEKREYYVTEKGYRMAGVTNRIAA